MASLSIPGIGSGLDVDTIVKQLVAIESRPIDLLKAQNTTLQSKLSAFGLLKSYTVNIHDTAAKLAEPDFWKKTAATSTDASSVSVSASTSAGVGSYSVEVQHLAQAQALASAAYPSSTSSVGTGSLKIEVGSWNADNTVFTPATPPSEVDVPVPLGEDSIESVRAKINSANAGISASVVTDSSGSRLVIRSTATGVERSVRITATADAPATPGGPTLNDLVYDPASGSTGLTETTAARNAEAKINGLLVVSSSNTLSNVSDGLSLTVSKVTTGPVQVGVALDTATMKTAIGDFVKAYNDINRYLAEQTKYDEGKKEGATLQGDRSTLSLQSQLRGMVQSFSSASTTFSRLSDVGIETQRDGSLKVNDTKLAAAMSENMDQLAQAFTRNEAGADASKQGFAVRLKNLTNALTSDDGTLSTRSKGLTDNIKRNDKQADVYEMRVESYKTRLLAQYSALDVKLNSLTNLNNYVTQQITQWNKST